MFYNTYFIYNMVYLYYISINISNVIHSIEFHLGMLGICFHFLLEHTLWFPGRQFVARLKLRAFLFWGPAGVGLSPASLVLAFAVGFGCWGPVFHPRRASRSSGPSAWVWWGQGSSLPELWFIFNLGAICETFISCYSLELHRTDKRACIILI